MLPRFGVPWHEENVTDALVANFVDELVEAGCVGEVDIRVGLNSVTITTADEELLPLLRESRYAAIFGPATQTVQLHSVDKVRTIGHEVVDTEEMPFGADVVQIPDRVV